MSSKLLTYKLAGATAKPIPRALARRRHRKGLGVSPGGVGYRSAISVSMALRVILVRRATWVAMRVASPWHRWRARWFSLGQMAIARRSTRSADSSRPLGSLG